MAAKLLEKWEAQKSALDEKIRMAKARENTRERKVENKKKFLFGAMLVKWMEEKPELREEAMERMQTFLTRASDRRYFGWAPLAKDDAKKGVKEQDGDAGNDVDASAA